MSEVQSQEELQEGLRVVIRNWSMRQKYEALKFLYCLLGVKIDDLVRLIDKEYRKEIMNGKPGPHE